MITSKLIEIRDSMTFIPALALRVQADGSDSTYLLRRAGYSQEPSGHGVLLFHLETGVGHARPWDWGSHTRTMLVAHAVLAGLPLTDIDPVRAAAAQFDKVPNGYVLDVEFMLGIRDAPKESEQLGRAGWDPSRRVGG